MKIVVAILIFSLIIIIHELGHFLLAKKNGIGVVEFSIGLGPTICGFTKGGTKYSIKLLPFGGMCQMLGEDNDKNTPEESAFYSKNVWQRISVIFAGPFFNFILAFVLSLMVIGCVGFDPAYVRAVSDHSPAEMAGLQPGDLITKIGKTRISIGRELDSFFMYHEITEKAIPVVYMRAGREYSTTIVPEYTKKYILGFDYYPDENKKAEILSVYEGYPIHAAGMRPGDIIVSVNGTAIANGMELSDYMNLHPLGEEAVQLVYERDGVSTVVELSPVLYREGYTIGFTYNLLREKTNLLQTIKYSFIEVKYWIVTTVKNLGLLITGQLSTNDVGGPVAIIGTIGEVYEQTQEQGSVLDVVLQMAYITILLSANLGVMNLLPIPALDGGKLVFLVIEAFRGKPIDREKEGMVHLIGLIALMILMVFIFFNDIRNLFVR